jgi:hypothetical protein
LAHTSTPQVHARNNARSIMKPLARTGPHRPRGCSGGISTRTDEKQEEVEAEERRLADLRPWIGGQRGRAAESGSRQAAAGCTKSHCARRERTKRWGRVADAEASARSRRNGFTVASAVGWSRGTVPRTGERPQGDPCLSRFPSACLRCAPASVSRFVLSPLRVCRVPVPVPPWLRVRRQRPTEREQSRAKPRGANSKETPRRPSIPAQHSHKKDGAQDRDAEAPL